MQHRLIDKQTNKIATTSVFPMAENSDTDALLCISLPDSGPIQPSDCGRRRDEKKQRQKKVTGLKSRKRCYPVSMGICRGSSTETHLEGSDETSVRTTDDMWKLPCLEELDVSSQFPPLLSFEAHNPLLFETSTVRAEPQTASEYLPTPAHTPPALPITLPYMAQTLRIHNLPRTERLGNILCQLEDHNPGVNIIGACWQALDSDQQEEALTIYLSSGVAVGQLWAYETWYLTTVFPWDTSAEDSTAIAVGSDDMPRPDQTVHDEMPEFVGFDNANNLQLDDLFSGERIMQELGLMDTNMPSQSCVTELEAPAQLTVDNNIETQSAYLHDDAARTLADLCAMWADSHAQTAEATMSIITPPPTESSSLYSNSIALSPEPSEPPTTDPTTHCICLTLASSFLCAGMPGVEPAELSATDCICLTLASSLLKVPATIDGNSMPRLSLTEAIICSFTRAVELGGHRQLKYQKLCEAIEFLDVVVAGYVRPALFRADAEAEEEII